MAVTPDARTVLIEREGALDESVDGLDLWARPRRAVLTLLYGAVYSRCTGRPTASRLGGQKARR